MQGYANHMDPSTTPVLRGHKCFGLLPCYVGRLRLTQPDAVGSAQILSLSSNWKMGSRGSGSAGLGSCSDALALSVSPTLKGSPRPESSLSFTFPT